MTEKLLEVRGLEIRFRRDDKTVYAVNGIDFELCRGDVLGMVGESGCGKSVTGYSILGLIPSLGGRVAGGSIRYHRDGEAVDLTSLPSKGDDIRRIRGNELGMIFQEPMRSLSPVYTIGEQIGESVRLHLGLNRKQARERAIDLLRKVQIADPEQRVDAYPHQLSGGMRQRAMIAIALACNPNLLVADEPTTSLDGTIEGQILQLLRDLQAEYGMSILFISHDLGVIAEMANRVMVMYLGRIMESADVQRLFDEPLHPYTRALLKTNPSLAPGPKTLLRVIPGSVPEATEPVVGCPFASRCEAAMPRCSKEQPPAFEPREGHFVACWLHE
jgi:oligopeptide/dipeptide ABC transporter ATP-binding protein